ncbi:MAG TPA: hypothetical protein VHO01_01740 [Jatrophihabitans sp.]|nr:hypothetical protein [Jatrophihabitans sp.]
MFRLGLCAADAGDAVAQALAHLDGEPLPACPQLLEFRRDLIASDPQWPAMTMLPRPGSPDTDRLLVLAFAGPPPAEQLRDLHYLAARHRLQLVELD